MKCSFAKKIKKTLKWPSVVVLLIQRAQGTFDLSQAANRSGWVKVEAVWTNGGATNSETKPKHRESRSGVGQVPSGPIREPGRRKGAKRRKVRMRSQLTATVVSR